jgi:hypothetical protein
VKETGATGELQIPDPRVTAARHGYQLIPVSLETFLRADHLELLLGLLLLHSKTKLRTWLHQAVFSGLINTAPDHRKTDSSVASSSCYFLTGCFHLVTGTNICMHPEKEMHGCVGIAICACSRTRFLDPNPAAMSRGVATIKFKSSCNVSCSRQDQIQIELQCLVEEPRSNSHSTTFALAPLLTPTRQRKTSKQKH